MTPEAIKRVRDSWQSLDTAILIERFYTELFAQDPALERLFHGDSISLKRKFDATMNELISNLDTPAVVTQQVRKLGVDHAGYGVYPRHYVLVEKALIEALRVQLGSQFDPATEQAWRKAYWLIANGMQDGAMDEEPALGR